jgi:hypothetical protein
LIGSPKDGQSQKTAEAAMLNRTRVMIPVALLFGIACAVPVAYFDEGRGGPNIQLGSPRGYLALLFGWIGPFTLAWSANVPFLIGGILLLCRRYRAAHYTGWIAAGLGLSTWILVLRREIPYLLPGYYLWQASLIGLAIGARALTESGRKRTIPEV